MEEARSILFRLGVGRYVLKLLIYRKKSCLCVGRGGIMKREIISLLVRGKTEKRMQFHTLNHTTFTAETTV
ncbi:MAG: hypothetical protein LRY73_14145 [Bacillus sp. (in: Bacteria)]|nr:hypothetical protein [Bacillus sp. (in: firmicutes)]